MTQNKMFKKLILRLKEDVKKQEEYIEKCEEYDKDIDFIDSVEISFRPLDVSAKTVNGDVFLNDKLIEANHWKDIMRYIIHEIIHCLQQDAGMVNGRTEKKDYLDDKNEQEAFQAQISFMDDHYSPEEIQQYLEQLLDHHDIQGKEREEKIETLTKDL